MPSISPVECEFERNAAGCWQCRDCGWVYKSSKTGECKEPKERLRHHCPAKMPPPVQPWGLGDHLALFLEALGITDVRVTRVMRLVRLIPPDGPCGCEDRKARLNRFGWRLLSWVRRWVR